MIQKISPTQAYDWLKNDEAILIDVREVDEFEQERISYAKLSPISRFKENYETLEIPDNKKIIFQCLGGGRSMKAAKFFAKKTSFTNELYNMTGGIRDWKESGLPELL